MCQKYILLIITAQLYHPQRSGVVRTSQWWWRPTSNLGILWFGVAFVLHFFSCEISMSFQWWNHHASSSLSPRLHTNVLPLKMRTIILQDGNGDVFGRVVVSSCKYRPTSQALAGFLLPWYTSGLTTLDSFVSPYLLILCQGWWFWCPNDYFYGGSILLWSREILRLVIENQYQRNNIFRKFDLFLSHC